MAEQLAFQQGVGDGGTVDGHKRLWRPRAMLVDEFCRQFLAGAGLTGDEQGAISCGHLAEGVGYLDDLRAPADHPLVAFAARIRRFRVVRQLRRGGSLTPISYCLFVHRSSPETQPFSSAPPERLNLLVSSRRCIPGFSTIALFPQTNNGYQVI